MLNTNLVTDKTYLDAKLITLSTKKNIYIAQTYTMLNIILLKTNYF